MPTTPPSDRSHRDRRQLQPAVLGEHRARRPAPGPGGRPARAGTGPRRSPPTGSGSRRRSGRRSHSRGSGRGGSAARSRPGPGTPRAGGSSSSAWRWPTSRVKRRQLALVVALVAARAAAGVAALLDPAADHEDRAEQHEQRVDDVVQHARTITPPMISGPTAEAMLKRGREVSPGCSGTLSGSPSRGERARGGRLKAIVPARLAWRTGSIGQARLLGGDGEGDVAGLEHRLRLDVGRAPGSAGPRPRCR